MTNKEAIDDLKNFRAGLGAGCRLPIGERGLEIQRTHIQAISQAIKSLEVVEKIKQAYSNCYKSYLNNLENDFSEETASFAFFQDVAFNINNILCEAYGSDTTCES